MAKTFHGTLIRPGISKNLRSYTKENLAKATARLQERLTNPASDPVVMYTSHEAAAKDDTTQVVARMRSVSQEADGSVRFVADVADTATAENAAILADPDKPFVPSVSIRGRWLGIPTESEGVTTSDDLEIAGWDFTGRPGVEGARIDSVLSESAMADGFFSESAEDVGFFVEEIDDVTLAEGGNAPGDGSKPYGNVTYADNGILGDGKKRYPVDTADHVRAAWSYINVAKNAAKYTAKQIARVKGKIKSAAKKFGINITAEWDAAIVDLLETLAISVENPSREMAEAVLAQSWMAFYESNPDDDMDSHPDDGPDQPNDEPNEVLCVHCGEDDIPDEALYCPSCGNSLGEESAPDVTPTQPAAAAALPETQEGQVPTDETPEAAPATGSAPVTEAAPAAAPTGVTLTTEQFTALLEAAKGPAPAAPAAPPVAELAPAPAPAPAVEEAEKPLTRAEVEAMVEAARTEARAEADEAAVEALRAGGFLGRKGLQENRPAVGQAGSPAAEAPASTKQPHEMSPEEWQAEQYEAWKHVPGISDLIERADAIFDRRNGFA